uniref:ABC transporter substrate-binding protein n=1 Tax=Agathobacter sp. TaxID=2021311 RepID=UPI004055C17B
MGKIFKRVLVFILMAAMVMSLAACTKDEGKKGDDSYTYNTALSVFPTNWNPHTYQTSTDAEILDYITEGFYSFDYNETKDAYRLVPQMAAGEPVDVTADYVGKYGVEEGDTAKVWKITLRDDLCWEDGTEITAADFVTSAKLLLDPEAGNYRADSLYASNLKIVNAKNYLYSGKYAYETNMISKSFGANEYVPKDALVLGEDGYYTTPDGKGIAVKLSSGGNWAPNNTLEDYSEAGYFVKDGVDLYETVIKAKADAKGVVKVDREVLDALLYFTAAVHKYANAEEYAAVAGDYAYREWQEFAFLGEQFAEIDFAEVGVAAVSDTELILALEQPLKGFYLLYSLTDNWLVNEKLYSECMSVKDGVYNNTYGTSKETTMSYGPYKLVSYQADKQYVLERNDNHYDVKNGLYQTTAWQVDYVSQASTRLEYFLKGKLDAYVLSVEDMETYQSSDYTYYTNGESTFFIALNPDKAALESAQKALGDNCNKTILTILEFRQALAYAFDRSAFALAAQPTASSAFGVFSDQIIANPETGEAYRTTEEAKWILAKFWDVAEEIGEGKLYANVDEALEHITGYNPEKAKQLFNAAYDKAIAEGLMDEDDIIEIKIGIPSATSQGYVKGYEFLSNSYMEAVKGTKLEGKLVFSLDNTLGNGLADALRTNRVDMLFLVGWTGSALDPYGLMEAYTTSEYQYDPSWDTSKTMWSIQLSDGEYTASVLDWTDSMAGQTITITAGDGSTKEFSAGTSDGNPEDRFAVLVGLEEAILSTYNMIPLTNEAVAILRGMQVQYHTEDYIYGIERGGLKHMTYNYTDAEWEDYVKEQGKSLIYN